MFIFIIPIMKICLFIYCLYKVGFIYGFILYWVVFRLYIFIVEKFLKCEFIRGLDILFLFEYEKRPNVIISNLIVDKIHAEEVKEIILKRGILLFKKLRQRVFKFLNEYYWKEVNINTALENLKVMKRPFKGRNDIIEFNESLFPEHLDYSRPLWEVYIVENYINDNEESKSLIIFKYHHALGDGIALVNLFSSLCEDLDLQNYSQLKKISKWKLFLIYFLSPYYLIKAGPQKKLKVPNPFSNCLGDASMLKKLSSTKEYKFSLFKQVYSKFPNATFNDLSWTILVRAILKWLNHKNDTEFNSICGIMGISARTTLGRYDMNNQSGGRLVNCELDTNLSFEKAFEKMQMILLPLKNKNMTIGASLSTEIMGSYLFSEAFFKKLGETFKDISFIYTNVQGPPQKVHFRIEGTKTIEVNDIIAFVPHGSLPFSVLAFSYNGFVRFTFHGDKVNGPPIDELAKYLEEEIETILIDT